MSGPDVAVPSCPLVCSGVAAGSEPWVCSAGAVEFRVVFCVMEVLPSGSRLIAGSGLFVVSRAAFGSGQAVSFPVDMSVKKGKLIVS